MPWTRAWLCGLLVALALPGAAGAARFKISFDGTDKLAWNVAAADSCGRKGNGVQTIDFRSTRPVAALMRIAAVPGQGRQLAFGRQFGGGVNIPGGGTISRTDNTTGFYNSPTTSCVPIPPKDCATKRLESFQPYVFAQPGFRLSLEGPYWDSSPPYQNCMSLQTPIPVEDPATGSIHDYTGWGFGDQILAHTNPFDKTVTTQSISPLALRIGRTYRFRAHKVFRLRDGRDYIIDSNGGDGGPGSFQVTSPGGTLGWDRSIVDTLSFEIVIKRVG